MLARQLSQAGDIALFQAVRGPQDLHDPWKQFPIKQPDNLHSDLDLLHIHYIGNCCPLRNIPTVHGDRLCLGSRVSSNSYETFQLLLLCNQWQPYEQWNHGHSGSSSRPLRGDAYDLLPGSYHVRNDWQHRLLLASHFHALHLLRQCLPSEFTVNLQGCPQVEKHPHIK